MMGGTEITNMVLIFSAVVMISGFEADALPYDYSASVECLKKPKEAQYNGGMIKNAEMNEGLNGWSRFGSAKIEQRQSQGNNFIVAYARNNSYDSFSHQLHLLTTHLYTFSGWVQVNKGNAKVTAVVKTATGYRHVASTIARSNCWSFLKGGLTVDESGPAQLYFESNDTSVEIWVDSVSMQPFTQEQWRAHQDQTIEKLRKRRVRIRVLDKEGKALPTAIVTLQQHRSSFPIGCAINHNILQNSAYQNWFTSRFTTTTFENEMKWYTTEPSQNHLDYSLPDAMFNFTSIHNIAVRGHNVLWSDDQYQLGWLKSLSPNDLDLAVRRRIDSVMARYRGKVIGWDVENEDLHYSFFQSRLGQSVSGLIYNWAMKVDSSADLFLNDFNTIEVSGDLASTPVKYLEKLNEIRKFPGNSGGRFAIGLESHFESPPNIPYMRSSIDALGSAGVPIWLTEVDVSNMPNQANYLEQILREGFSHPKVNGIVIWSAWSPGGCYRMCLTDNSFRNLATGDVVDKLLREWGIKGSTITASTDSNGFFEASLFHGDYELQVSHPSVTNSSLNAQKLSVVAATEAEQSTLLVQVEV